MRSIFFMPSDDLPSNRRYGGATLWKKAKCLPSNRRCGGTTLMKKGDNYADSIYET